MEPEVDQQFLPCVEPHRNSPEWSDFLISQLVEGEYVEQNGQRLPKANGLRRLLRRFGGGEVVFSGPIDVQFPKGPYDVQVVALYSIKILNSTTGNIVEYTEVADYNDDNTSNDDFLKYAVASVSTRAEVRAIRKFLGLNVVAYEEIGSKKGSSIRPSVGQNDGDIKDYQIAGIKNVCRKLDIDPDAYVAANSSKGRTKVSQLSEDEAEKLMKALNGQFQKLAPAGVP